MRIYRLAFIISILCTTPLLLVGQTSLSNTYTEIIVESDGLLYIPGDYISNTTGVSDGDYSDIKLDGTIQLGGDFVNNGSTSVIDVTGNGSVVMAGGNSIISSKELYFPTLEVVSGTNIVLPDSIRIGNQLKVTSGSIRLSGSTVLLDGGAGISGDSDANPITGTGELVSAPFDLVPGETYPNRLGFGLGFHNVDIAAVTVSRKLLETAFSNVANGKSLKRVYHFSYDSESATDTLTIPSVLFHYYPNEVTSAGLTESAMAVYISDNNGASWVRQSCVVNTGSNYVTASNVFVEPNKTYILTLADAVCDTEPDAFPTYNSDVSAIEGTTVKACFNSTIELSSNEFYYKWDVENSSNTALTRVLDDFSRDGRTYTLTERTEAGCESSETYTLDVLPLPEASFSHAPPDAESCLNDTQQFTDASDAVEGSLSISSYEWDFGDGNTSTDQNPTHVYGASDTYQASLQVTNNYGCVSEETPEDVLVHPLPDPAFTMPPRVCEGVEFSITNTSSLPALTGPDGSLSAMTYVWEFESERSSTNVHPQYTYETWGTKEVTLTATANGTGCTESITQSIIVDPTPVAAFHFEKEGDTDVDGMTEGICEGITLTYRNESTLLGTSSMSYSWEFGDGSVSSLQDPNHYYSLEDTVIVSLLVTSDDHGCTDEISYDMIVHPAPEGHFNIQSDGEEVPGVCEAVPVNLVNGSQIPYGSLSYSWNFGDGGAGSTATSPSRSFSEAGSYTVALQRTTDKGCINSVERNIEIYAYPVADFTVVDRCDGNALQFFGYDQPDLNPSYLWDFSDGTTASEQNPEHEFDTYGTYNVSLEVTSEDGCASNTTKAATVHRNPEINLDNYYLTCTGAVMLDALDEPGDYPQTGGTFVWTNREGEVISTQETVEITSSGNHYLDVTTAELCHYRDTIPVYLVTPGDLGADRTACDMDVLDATPESYPPTGELSYVWTKDGDLLSEEQAELSVTESGEYEVTVTFTLSGIAGQPSCSYSDVINISIDTPPVLDLGEEVNFCDGGSIVLTSNLTAGSYEWTNSNGEVIGTLSSIIVSEEDIYRLSVTQGTCSSYDFISVKKLASPEAGFQASNDRICTGEVLALDNLSFATGDDLITSYLWDFGDGTTSPEVTPVKFYAYAGTFNISLEVTTENGCTDTFEHEIIVDPLPVASFTADNSCEKTTIGLTNSSSIADGTALDYYWTFGDGTVSTLDSPVKLYNEGGTYTITLEAISANGCRDVVDQTVEIHSLPKGTITFESDGESVSSICSGESVTFNNGSYAPGGGELTYTWEFGDGSVSELTSPDHTFFTPDLYTISLTRTTEDGCEDVVNKQLRVYPSPVSDFTVENDCEGEPVFFTNTSSIASGSMEAYVWDFGDGTTSTEVNPEYLYANPGAYNVTLTTTSSKGCTSETIREVSVYQKPSFDLGVYALSATGSYLLDPRENPDYYIPPGTSFSWKQGSDVIGLTEAVEITASGTYTASAVTDTPESCSVLYTIPVYIIHPGELGEEITVCEQTELDARPVSYPSQAGTLSYTWAKDGMDLDHTGSGYQVTASGEYVATVTFTLTSFPSEPAISYSDTVNVQVQTAETVDLGDTVTICEGSTEILSGNVVAESYQWTNLSSGEFLGSSASQEISEPGTYRLEVTTGSCTSEGTVVVDISSLPEAGFYPDSKRVCLGETISFTDISYPLSDDTLISYEWDFGDGSSSTEQNPMKNYSDPGTYHVLLQVTTQNGCVGSYQEEIAVDEPPVLQFSASDACVGVAIDLVNLSTAYLPDAQFTWDFGNGVQSTAHEPVFTYSEPGAYDITLSVVSGSCSESITSQVEIYAEPDVDLGEELISCGSQLAIDGGDNDSFRWYDVTSGTTLSTSRYYTATFDQELGLEVANASGCEVVEETSVVLNATISIDLGADRSICGSEILDAGAFPGASYLWSNGAETRFLEVTETGTYSVSVTDQNGCVATDEVEITATPLPVLDFGEDVAICDGESLTLDAGNEGASYVWSTGETSQHISVDESGTYDVTVSYGSCEVSDTISVAVLPVPVVDFMYTRNCSAETISFSYTGTGTDPDYFWNFGNGTKSVKSAPQVSFSTAGDYEVSLEVTSDNGCTSSVSKTITIQPRPAPDFTFSNACEGSEISFLDNTDYSGDDPLSYTWDFGDGNESSGSNPVHIFSSEGSYIVRLEVTSGSLCPEVISKSVIVQARPDVDLGGYIESCASAVMLDAGNAGSTYLWTDNSTGQTFEATESGIYTVEVTNAEGCVTSDTVEVHLFEYDKPDLGTYREACNEILLDPGVTGSGFLWSTGETTAEITANESGTYWVQTISDELCISRDTVEVVVHPLPVFDLGPDLERCDGASVTLQADHTIPAEYAWSNGSSNTSLQVMETGTYGLTLTTVEGCVYSDELSVLFHPLPDLPLDDEYGACEQLQLDAGNAGSSYLWSTGDITSKLDVRGSGEYWVSITTPEGCSQIDSTVVTLDPVPTPELSGYIELCEGEVAILNAGNTGATYLWSTGATSQSISVNESGSYSVTIAYGTCEISDTSVVAVRSPLSPAFDYTGTCRHEGVNFSYTGTDNDLNFLWDFGDGTKSVKAAPQKSYSTPGDYEVSLQVTNTDGCSASVSETITIQPKPVPNFAFSNACEGQAISFTNSTAYVGSDELSYSWNFGDGSTSSEENPTHAFSSPGTYSVKLVATNESLCSGTTAKLVVVRAQPEVDLGGYIESCEASVVLDAGNSGSGYRWKDNSSSQTMQVTRSGVYAVEVTNSYGCTASDTVEVHLFEYDRPDLGDYIEGCGEVALDPGVTGSSFLWSTGAVTADITAGESGNYWVQTISEDLCISRDSVAVVVYPVPFFDLGPDLEQCDGDSVILSADNSIEAAYAWSDGSTDPTLLVTQTGAYDLTLTTEDGCTFSDQVDLVFHQLPDLPLEDEYVTCGSIQLNAENEGSAYLWSTGETAATVYFSESGAYSVHIITQEGCSLTDSTELTVNPLPEPDLGPDLEICFGETVTLDAGEFAAYEWNNVPASRMFDAGVSGTYTATVFNEHGCQQSDAVRVTVRERIPLDLGPDQVMCSPEDFSLDAGLDAAEYLWTSDNGFTSRDRVIYPSAPGLYTLTVHDQFGCEEIDEIKVSETTEQIEASFLMPSQVGAGEMVNFVQLTEPEPVTYSWDFGNGFSTSNIFNPQFIYYQPGEYEVSLTVSNGICTDTETKILTIVEGRSSEDQQEKVAFIEFRRLSLYPNPAQEYLQLDYELSDAVPVEILIYDFSGYLVRQYGLENEIGKVEIDIAAVASGSYIMLVRAGNVTKKLRFLKIKR